MLPYTRPKVELGDPVYWYPSADPYPDNAHYATVAKIDGEVLTLDVTANNCIRRYENVRHVTDPALHTGLPGATRQKQNGGWDYSAFHKRVCNVEAALADLAKSKK